MWYVLASLNGITWARPRLRALRYTFEVAPDANKFAIKAAVEQLFGVKVTGVWTSNARGKARRVGQSIGRRPHTKKAIVKLRDGDTIAIFEG